MYNGAHLASATVPWHWLFFCPAPKFRAYFGCLVTKNLKAPKWHWLILDPMGALVHIHRLLRKIFFRNILHKFLSAGTIQRMFLFHMLIFFKLQKYFKVGKSYCTFLLKFHENCEDGFYPVLYYVNLYTNLKIYFFCFISG